MLPDSFAKSVRDAFPMPAYLKKLRAVTAYDLWHGSIGDSEDTDTFKYPGFDSAVKTLREWAEKTLSDVHFNQETDEISDTEPDWSEVDEEGSRLYYPEDWFCVDVKEVKRAIFGKELAEYV